MVELDGLENRYAGNRIEGSNPSLSANSMAPLRGGAFELALEESKPPAWLA